MWTALVRTFKRAFGTGDAPGLPPKDEYYIGGSFRVVNDFTIEDLGCYWKGQEYRLTRLNYSHVNAAIKRGDAVVVVPPKVRP